MILMRQHPISLILSLLLVNQLTANQAQAVKAPSFPVPPCAKGEKREYLPDESRPLWVACRDKQGLYQGVILQTTGGGEFIRIASVKNSERDGREIRSGATNTLEERTYKNGHLDGPSFIFSSMQVLGRILPKAPTDKDWAQYTNPPATSILKPMLANAEPASTLQFSNGRLLRAQYDKKDYHFHPTKDGRNFVLDHPDMRGMFFVDPEPMWTMSPHDLKADLIPGFGSCKKYDGPIGRFGRHYDHMLFKREPKEKTQLQNLAEIRERFLSFCTPQDLRDHLGVLECPPALPSPISGRFCVFPISDQLRTPYQPKYYDFDATLGRSPEELNLLFKKFGIVKFVSDYKATDIEILFSPKILVTVKKTSQGLLYRADELDPKTKKRIVPVDSEESNQHWWEWHPVPGF